MTRGRSQDERPRRTAGGLLSLLGLAGLLGLPACTRAASAVEGSQTVPGAPSAAAALGQATARPVENQPVGPVPGIGDIPALANPLQGDRSALQEGRRLFVRYNCAGCHGGRAGGGMGPSLRDPDWLYGSTPDRIFSSIAQGRGHGMPSWGVRLPERQLWELTLYVSSLRTPEEPEAP
jgi:mono/diheme cytochrome c family protein